MEGGPRLRVAAAFAAGAGGSLALNAVLAAVGDLSMRFGRGAFVQLAAAVYAPSLPVAAGMAALTDLEERRCAKKDGLWCDARRVIAAQVVLSVLLFAFSRVRTLSAVLACGAAVGGVSTVSFGYASQMILRAAAASKRCGPDVELGRASTITTGANKSGQLEAALSFGFQASSMFVLLVQLWSGFTAGAPRSAQSAYFGGVACLHGLVIPAVCFLAASRLEPSDSLRAALLDPASRRASSISDSSDSQPSQAAGAQQLAAATQEAATEVAAVAPALDSWRHVASETAPCAAGLAVVIFTSLVAFPFYSFVPAQGGTPADSARLATTLVYVKNFADAFSRPATTALPRLIRSPRALLGSSLVRALVFLPVFFVYVFATGLIPVSDALFCAFVAFFAATSGYLKTVAFQLAPTHGQSPRAIRRITTLLTLSFQAGCFSAVAVSLAVRAALPPRFQMASLENVDLVALPYFGF